MVPIKGFDLFGIAKIPVAMRPGDTPVPIPNTTVKTRTADGTILETVWESRRLPVSLKNNQINIYRTCLTEADAGPNPAMFTRS